MTRPSNPRTAGILWLVASALSLTAALLTYSDDGQIKWSLIAATVFLAAMGVTTLRRAKPDGA